MSSVPIQFLVYVYSISTCTLKPLLISDLNNDDCQAAQVGMNFTMTLSFPIVIKSTLVQNPSNASLWSLTMRWQPTSNQVGSQVLCAVASDK